MIEIGNQNVKYNQILLIIIGVLFSGIMFWSYIICRTENCLIIFILSLIFISVAFFYNLRLYRIRVDKDYFYIENIFRKLKLEKNEFISIKVISILPYILAITFNSERRYLFTLNSSDSIKAMVSFNKKKIEKKIIDKIEQIL
jgi:hypothetical protein